MIWAIGDLYKEVVGITFTYGGAKHTKTFCAATKIRNPNMFLNTLIKINHS